MRRRIGCCASATVIGNDLAIAQEQSEKVELLRCNILYGKLQKGHDSMKSPFLQRVSDRLGGAMEDSRSADEPEKGCPLCRAIFNECDTWTALGAGSQNTVRSESDSDVAEVLSLNSDSDSNISTTTWCTGGHASRTQADLLQNKSFRGVYRSTDSHHFLRAE